MELTYEEMADVLNVKYIAVSTVGYTTPQGEYKNRDNNLKKKSSLPNEVKVKTTIDEIRKRSNLTTNEK